MLSKCLFLFIVLVMVFSLSACGPKVVTFPDPNVEAAIREAIGKPEGPIYASELEGITSLYLSGRNITDLTGLEYCVNLTKINLSSSQMSDISQLASLTNITVLYLLANQISDVSPLASLTNLTSLSLADNQISDISPLASLTNLTSLSLAENQISDISLLASLTNLIELGLEKNQISDISPLVENSGLSDGDSVYLKDNPLSSTSVNVYIPQLRERGVTVHW